ncbi:F-box domain, cyclin-like protein [Artemisia annua]|uniref:F-box domain, cyclin-like protein n=1 Tax=Artemisia annua TaxID=35608 RepID=A0A2U1M6N7_ARTAN|nr:F-box domain, cyclin-like protein [Artemisia annua]
MEEVQNDFFSELPEGFVAEALALTSPRDACRLSSINSFFRSAANWDKVWESFTPPECLGEAVVDAGCNSKKDKFLHLCDHTVIIDDGNKSFWLDKRSGKKCYMLSARSMSISLVDSPSCWKWTSIAESRFTEVGELINVCALEVNGKINTSILSPKTAYVAYLVFKMTSKANGFEYQPVELSIVSHKDKCETRLAYLDPQAEQKRRLKPRRRMRIFSRIAFTYYHELPSPSKDNAPNLRKDGWFETAIGEYFNEGGDETELEMRVMEVKGGNWKTGLVIEGIEIRPKNCI